MKNRFLKAGLSLSVIAFAITTARADQPASAGTASATNSSGPKIEFANTVYDFGHVISGTPVTHDFIFTNAGDATLEISSVNPGCGCTTIGDWTHTVAPGKTGVIPIKFNSTGYNQPVVKTPWLTCNDQTQPRITLQLRGTVVKALDLSQQFVAFAIGPDSSGETNATIHITNNEDQPINLSQPVSSLHCFAAELKTNTPGKSFDLIIRTVPPLDTGNNNQAVISMESSSSNAPTINIIAMAMAQSPFTYQPQQPAIPPGLLKSNVTMSISITNQSSRPVVLSDPTVNAKGVEAKISAADPGRLFTATLDFPAGFQAPAGLPLTLEIKTDHPWLRIFRIPIAQTAVASTANLPTRKGR